MLPQPAPTTSKATPFIVAGVALVVLVVAATAILPLLRNDDASAPEPPAQLGQLTQVTGPAIDALREETLAGMARPSGDADVFVEYYDSADGQVMFILQGAAGDFEPGPNLFAHEQQALTGGGIAQLQGESQHTVDGVFMRCDGAVFDGGSASMCMHAVDGLVVVGSGVNLDVEAVAGLVAEYLTGSTA